MTKLLQAKGSEESEVFEVEARRAFLKNCAKYAAAAPPAISLLLSVGNAKAQPIPSECVGITEPEFLQACLDKFGEEGD